MTQVFPVKILGIGTAEPRRIVTNDELEALCGLSEGWIWRKNGVRERRWIEEGETNSSLGAAASLQALDDAGLQWEDIDLIVNASGTSEQFIPDGAPLIQRELGLGTSGIPCMSIHTTCLSFLFAMQVCTGLLETGLYQRILVVTAEISSVGMNFQQPQSSTLFGDAATAVIFGQTPEGESSVIEAMRFETYGEGAPHTEVRGGGCRRHPNDERTTPEDNLFHMDGPAVLGMAAQYAGPFLERLRPGLTQGLGDVDIVVPHQASKVALQVLEHFHWPASQIMKTLETRGNCIAASIPLTLIESIRDGKLERGQRCLAVGTGAGLSLGGVMFVY